ncbi:hypothetical protein PPERSA_01880 [Pseudocohnilembus persalinus]|uniref:Uncharacterized protein n=1 Tax=Pseudocohnilembus persalinus TaxID=266149 RepID=A0A0V0R273_PSEPJ|nr:hypothetical protein PPERSA_01880 [Pseudocohnilembus persalinus]|eukprot:KRX08627.1 hypothetical protein PPERSA_01880 [Pseudocohnilembus persalinus]
MKQVDKKGQLTREKEESELIKRYENILEMLQNKEIEKGVVEMRKILQEKLIQEKDFQNLSETCFFQALQFTPSQLYENIIYENLTAISFLQEQWEKTLQRLDVLIQNQHKRDENLFLKGYVLGQCGEQNNQKQIQEIENELREKYQNIEVLKNQIQLFEELKQKKQRQKFQSSFYDKLDDESQQQFKDSFKLFYSQHDRQKRKMQIQKKYNDGLDSALKVITSEKNSKNKVTNILESQQMELEHYSHQQSQENINEQKQQQEQENLQKEKLMMEEFNQFINTDFMDFFQKTKNLLFIDHILQY